MNLVLPKLRREKVRNSDWRRKAGGGGIPEKLGGGVRPSSQNPYPIIDQKICDIPYPIYDLTKNSKPYLCPEPYIKILFQTCAIIGP